MMAERGVSLAHTTIMRWIARYVLEFEKRWNRFACRACASLGGTLFRGQDHSDFTSPPCEGHTCNGTI